MSFNQAYSNLLIKLPASLINEAWIRLTTQKRNPLTEKEAGGINPIVESFLIHEADRYQKKLMRQRRTYSHTGARAQSCPSNSQAHVIEFEQKMMKKLVYLQQQLLEYNRNTFNRFMQDLNREHEKQVETNQHLYHEIENMKVQLQEAEETLASMKKEAV